MKFLFNTSLFLISLSGVLLTACSKPDSETHPVPLPPPGPIDTALVKLKQIEITGLPSPYYHFTYNDSSYATQINFASGFFRYEVKYQNRRIARVTNLVNGDWLSYHYQNDKVAAIEEFSGITGSIFQRYEFTYDIMQRLVHADWFSFSGPANEKILEKSDDLKYTNDGNLSEHKYSLRMDNGTMQWASTTTYSNYDNKKNVDDFGMLKQFFNHLLYLPGVKFQKNNPATSKINNVNNDFEVEYQYQYQQDRPITKNTTMRQTRGSDAGRVLTTTTQYTYY